MEDDLLQDLMRQFDDSDDEPSAAGAEAAAEVVAEGAAGASDGVLADGKGKEASTASAEIVPASQKLEEANLDSGGDSDGGGDRDGGDGSYKIVDAGSVAASSASSVDDSESASGNVDGAADESDLSGLESLDGDLAELEVFLDGFERKQGSTSPPPRDCESSGVEPAMAEDPLAVPATVKRSRGDEDEREESPSRNWEREPQTETESKEPMFNGKKRRKLNAMEGGDSEDGGSGEGDRRSRSEGEDEKMSGKMMATPYSADQLMMENVNFPAGARVRGEARKGFGGERCDTFTDMDAEQYEDAAAAAAAAAPTSG
ncbi:unnamed protein product [Sphacelaria rigidula]